MNQEIASVWIASTFLLLLQVLGFCGVAHVVEHMQSLKEVWITKDLEMLLSGASKTEEMVQHRPTLHMGRTLRHPKVWEHDHFHPEL